MDIESLRQRFIQERPKQLFGIEMVELEKRKAKMRMSIDENKLLIINSMEIVYGGAIGWLAYLPGLYAAMTIIKSNEKAVLGKTDGRFVKETKPEEKLLFAQAQVYRCYPHKNKEGEMHLRIFVKVDVKNADGLKAMFKLRFTVLKKKKVKAKIK